MKKITTITSVNGKDFFLSFRDDQTEYARYLIESGCVFRDSGEKMTWDNIGRFFEAEQFSADEISGLTNIHYVYDWYTKFLESDRCPEFLQRNNKIVTITCSGVIKDS